MSFENFMNKVRYWDNIAAKWMMRHFYVMFFQIFLMVVFFAFFANTLKTIDLGLEVHPNNTSEKLLFLQSTNLLIIAILLLLNSFWMLFLFNNIMRIQTVLRDISFNLTRQKPNNSSKP